MASPGIPGLQEGLPLVDGGIFGINSFDTSNVVQQDTTLNTDNSDNSDAGGGSGWGNALDDLIKITPSLLLLSRTSQTKLPTVAGGTAARPVLQSPTSTLSSNNIMIMFIILIIAITAIMLFKKG